MSPRRRAMVSSQAEPERNENPELDKALREIEAVCGMIVGRARRAVRICEMSTSTSVMQPGVQTSETEPRHERAFDWLDYMRIELRRLAEVGLS